MKNSKKIKAIIGVCLSLMVALVAVLSVKGATSANAAAKKSVTINLYNPNANADGFDVTKVSIPKVTPTNVVKELAKKQDSYKGVVARGFTQKKTHVTVDFNAKFQENICKMGTAGETMMLGSFVNTMLDACNAKTITITVKGKALETGHNIYDKPLTFFYVTPNNGVSITVYTPNENADGFNRTTAVVAKVTPTNILNAIGSYDATYRNANIRALGFTQNKRHVEVNLTTEFQNMLCNCGTAGEYVLLGSFVNTMLDACNADTITIKIRGNALETGHNVYDQPLRRFN